MTDTRVERKQPLRDWREEFGFTQAELAELAGCTQGTISAIEQGQFFLDTPAGLRIAQALGLPLEAIVPIRERGELISAPGDFSEDGLSADAPRLLLKQWRERRLLTMRELSELSGVSVRYIGDVEGGRRFRSVGLKYRKALAAALRVRPDKLILPGDDAKPTPEQPLEVLLRAELRGAHRALRIAFDFMREDYKIASRYLEERDKALEGVRREMEGTR